MSEPQPSFAINPSNNPLHFTLSLEPSPLQKIKTNQFIISHNISENSNINSATNEKSQNFTIIKNDNIPPLSIPIEGSNFSENSFLENKNEKPQTDMQNSLSSLKESENSNSNKKTNENYQSGRWTENEHQKFLEGILKYGNEWKRVQEIIKTRSSTQARSHAQKFFLRMKKSVTNPQIWCDQNLLLDYIINNNNIKLEDGKELTEDQKKKLLCVIRFNLKPEELFVKKPKEIKLKESNIEEESNDLYEEKDNLGYKKEEFENFNEEHKEQRKMTFCSRKRKSSSNFSMSFGENKIFDIKKDIRHRLSLEIPIQNLNQLGKNNNDNNENLDNNIFKEENYKQDNATNTEKNINSGYFGNKEKCSNCGGCATCGGNAGGNYIINNNFINITNNFNNNFYNNNFNVPYIMNNTNNNQYNQNYLCYNDSNSDNNNNNSFNHCEKLSNNNNYYANANNFNNENNNCNSVCAFFENENFFPKKKKEYETIDPFRLEFGNTNLMNINSDINVNNLINCIEEAQGNEDDFFRDNFENNNNDISYDFDE